MKKRGLLLMAILIAASSPILAEGDIVVEFNLDAVKRDHGDFHYYLGGLSNIAINEFFSVPVKTIYFDGEIDITRDCFSVSASDQEIIDSIPVDILAMSDKFTGPGPLTEEMIDFKNEVYHSPVMSIARFCRDGHDITAVSFLPLTIDEKGHVIFNRKITANGGLFYSMADKSEILNRIVSSRNSKPIVNRLDNETGLPLGYRYVIITGDSLTSAFQALADYRNACGISTAIANVDSIYACYDGLDQPAQIREYLKDFYHAGGEYLLLGGNNTIIPPRYTYYYNADAPPRNSYYLIPSDLYYADLDGEWDVDGDGIWGEPTDDAPDLTPELLTGRLPIANPEAVERFTKKVIAYETNPGGGQFEYLNRALFFSSDQMRDYPERGQHGVIAAELPERILVDTSKTIELPSGEDPNPFNPSGYEAIDIVSGGYGFVHIIAHGRIDGFMVRSTRYGDWPASQILTGPSNGNHGSIADLARNNRTSLYYSLACNVGGYDLDSSAGQPADWSLVERLLSLDSAGAVAMVANPRWGWVYSSYHLQRSFTHHLYTTANGSPVQAMYASWVDNPYYRDLIYGNAYFGDPAFKIFTDLPKQIEVEFQGLRSQNRVFISEDGEPVTEALVTISNGGNLLEKGYSDNNGYYQLTFTPDQDEEYLITVVKEGYTIWHGPYVPSMTLEVDEDEESTALPRDFVLQQNSPNPFNPRTVIGYHLPYHANVSIIIYNLLGQTIYSIDLPDQPAGFHQVEWDGVDRNGTEVPSGVYFYRMIAEDFRQTKKMLLIR